MSMHVNKFWNVAFSIVKKQQKNATLFTSTFSPSLRWKRVRRTWNWHRQRRRVRKVGSMMSCRRIRRGPPSPTWAPPAQGELHPTTLPLLSQSCSCCSCQLPSAGARKERIRRTHIHTHTHAHSQVMDLQSWTRGCKSYRKCIEEMDFISSNSMIPHLCSWNGTLFNTVWLKPRWFSGSAFNVLQRLETESQQDVHILIYCVNEHNEAEFCHMVRIW